MLEKLKVLEGEVEMWKNIANDLWWWLDDLSAEDSYEALLRWPQLGETENYLKHLCEEMRD